MEYYIKSNILLSGNDYGKAAVLPSPVVDVTEHHEVAAEVTNAQYDVGMLLPLQQWRMLKVP